MKQVDVTTSEDNPTSATPNSEKKVWTGNNSTGKSWTVYNGDATTVLSSMASIPFDCCVTSPPYFWLRDYGTSNQIGLEATVGEYVTALVDVMRLVYASLNDRGLLFLNLGDTYYSGKGASHGQDAKSKKRRFGLRAVDKSGGLGIGLQRKSAIGIPWRVAIAMMEEGWILRSTIIWHREKRLREVVHDRPGRSYEYVFMFAKARKYYFNHEALVSQNFDEDVWTIMPERTNRGLDTAPFPDELVRRCLAIGCEPGGSVLDPFAGSGTTLRVALELGFSASGIELNTEFCKFIVNQLNKLV